MVKSWHDVLTLVKSKQTEKKRSDDFHQYNKMGLFALQVPKTVEIIENVNDYHSVQN